MYDMGELNDTSQGRNWEDGYREWVEFKAYGLPGQRVVWVLEQGGKIVCSIECEDWPFWKCAKEAQGGLILEFGVRGGLSLRRIAEAIPNRRVYGFDWWRGLPHSADGFTKGDCIATRPSDMPANVELIDGLFSDTLEGFLENHDGPLGFVNIDCDLYSSSYYVLRTLMGRFVVGSILALSDMAFSPLAQKRAWYRYQLESRQHWHLIGKNHPWGEVYRLAAL